MRESTPEVVIQEYEYLLGALAAKVSGDAGRLQTFLRDIRRDLSSEYLDNIDEKCDPKLNFVPKQAQETKVNYAISNSFGFGGHNACVLFRANPNCGEEGQ